MPASARRVETRGAALVPHTQRRSCAAATMAMAVAKHVSSCWRLQRNGCFASMGTGVVRWAPCMARPCKWCWAALARANTRSRKAPTRSAACDCAAWGSRAPSGSEGPSARGSGGLPGAPAPAVAAGRCAPAGGPDAPQLTPPRVLHLCRSALVAAALRRKASARPCGLAFALGAFAVRFLPLPLRVHRLDTAPLSAACHGVMCLGVAPLLPNARCNNHTVVEELGLARHWPWRPFHCHGPWQPHRQREKVGTP